jgi:hypothetical protein
MQDIPKKLPVTLPQPNFEEQVMSAGRDPSFADYTAFLEGPLVAGKEIDDVMAYFLRKDGHGRVLHGVNGRAVDVADGRGDALPLWD